MVLLITRIKSYPPHLQWDCTPQIRHPSVGRRQPKLTLKFQKMADGHVKSANVAVTGEASEVLGLDNPRHGFMGVVTHSAEVGRGLSILDFLPKG